ncbi:MULTISPECIES: vacuolar family H+-ATPase subunit H [unclassified Butyrivibrio]|uniref:vacuolar family H+-ATPase subunit H n=1 Tax=unclassified Butyrivibrio TaxID=2639466 RepID=UPI0003B5E27B|nr:MULTISPECIES: vacuolar family H+-ATPase subunit H [unclassified Butyrivibrio]SDB16503.1 hypothetical protein SAMN02910263_00758 [Butyrivibrio sp. INlla16]SEK33119.1 hypothetical protein SAMN04487770_101198 [Butyrivibrio sp. ob235]
MSSRIEQCIDEIETFIDNCKYQPLSHTNIVVNKEEIDELLRELRSKTPEEIRRYQTIISNKEAILEDARKKAKDLIDRATEQTHAMINEHDIMQQAYAQANEVIAHAAKQAEEILTRSTNEANQMKAAAVSYTDNLLAEVEVIVNKAIETTNASTTSFLKDLTSYSETIKSNRADLVPPSVNPSNVKEKPKPASNFTEITPEVMLDDGSDLNLDLL